MADNSLCTIPDCGKARFQCGYCRSHHRRYWRYGDPLAGSTYQGSAAKFLEEAERTNDRDSCINWPFGEGARYGQILVNRVRRPAHRLVCERAHGDAPSEVHQAAHLCGNSRCVNPFHLAWKSPAENAADRITHGTHLRGEQNGNGKLSEIDVRRIRRMLSESDASTNAIARMFGVSSTTIHWIKTGRTWFWLRDT